MTKKQTLLPFMPGIFSFIWSILLIYDFFIDTRRSCLCEVGTRVYSSYCLVQVEALIEKNLLFSITISHLMHLLYSSILLIKISAFCSFRVFIVTCVPSYKSLSTIFLYWVVTLQPMQRCGGLWSPGRAVLCTTGASLPCWCDSRSHWSLIQKERVLLYFYNAILLLYVPIQRQYMF